MTSCVPHPKFLLNMWRPIFSLLLSVLFLFCTLISPLSGYGAFSPNPGDMIEKTTRERASKEEVKALIQKIKDPTKRKMLLRELNTLLRAMEADSIGFRTKTSPTSQIYSGFIKKLDKSFSRSFEAFRSLPIKFWGIAGRWKKVRWEGSTIWSLLRFMVSIAFSLMFLVCIRRMTRRYLPPTNKEMTSLKDRLAAGGRRWFEIGLPSASLLIVGSLIVIFFNLGKMEENLLLIVLWSIFIEKALVGAVRAFLAPVRPNQRVIPITNELSGLISLWGRRFIVVAIWGEALAQSANELGLGPESVSWLTNAYRLILLLQAVTLIVQFRNSVRDLLTAKEPEEAGHTVRTAIVAWNILMARWHFIAVPYLTVFYFLWASESSDGIIFLITATSMTAIILGTAYFLVRLVRIGAVRLFAVGAQLKALVPGIENRANRYTPIVTRSLTCIIWVVATFLVLDAWGLPTLDAIFSDSGVIFFASSTKILLICAITTTIIEGTHATVEYYLSTRRDDRGNLIEPSSHSQTLLPLAYAAVKWISIVTAGIIILGTIGVDIAPVLAGAGILGLAIGFGAQSLVKDIITGVFLLIENNISVGDIVKVKDVDGTVEGFNLRSVRLRSYNGNVHVIPNSSIDVVTNYSKEFSRAVFDIGVAYKENVDRVMDVIRQVGEEMAVHPDWKNHILDPIEIAGLERFDDSAVTIRGRIKTNPSKQFSVRREFYRRIKNTFDAEGIEIPFPYRTITWTDNPPEYPKKERSTSPHTMPPDQDDSQELNLDEKY